MFQFSDTYFVSLSRCARIAALVALLVSLAGAQTPNSGEATEADAPRL